MRLISRLRALERPLAGIGNGERARDDQRLRHAVALARRLQDSADSRIERQLRKLASADRQCTRRVDGVQFLQELIPVGDGAQRRRIDERKLRGRREVERRHAQDHRCE